MGEIPEKLAEALQLDLCPRCKCCSQDWIECWDCGGEGYHDDMWESDPLWYDQDDIETCDICDGKGGWKGCLGNCDNNGKHVEEAPKEEDNG